MRLNAILPVLGQSFPIRYSRRVVVYVCVGGARLPVTHTFIHELVLDLVQVRALDRVTGSICVC